MPDMAKFMAAGGGVGGRETKKKVGSGKSDKREPSTKATSSSSASSSPSSSAPISSGGKFKIGDAVLINRTNSGVVRYVGPAEYSAGTWVGVEMDDPKVGKNDGWVKGKKYFACPPGRGLMVREADVTKI